METLLHASVIWFVIGLVFFLLEFVVPGFILFFFGIGAWVVAITALLLDVSVNTQLLIFVASSVCTVLLFRNWVKNKLGMYQKTEQVLEDEFIGKTGVAETAILPSVNGKVIFKGTTWDAHSDDSIAPGESVIITGNRSILLTVKSTKL